MTPLERDWLRDKLFDSVSYPVQYRPMHLSILEQWIDEYIARGIEDGIKERIAALTMTPAQEQALTEAQL